MKTETIKQWFIVTHSDNKLSIQDREQGAGKLLCYPTDKANAALICKAVNNFYPMLEALRECVGELKCYDLAKEGYPVLAKAIAAIQAAEKTT